ncbi:MAG TPA: AI-2E family transporter [Longimicrobium sp.]|jgi:predicted PurR-regulated permease PerM
MNKRASDGDSILMPDVDPRAQAQPAEEGAAQPDLTRTGEAMASGRTTPFALTILAVLAVVYTLHLAHGLLLPITFALLLSFLFSPVVRALARMHVRPPLGAGIVILTLLGMLTLGAYHLSGPVQSWATSAPQTLASARGKMSKLLKPMERFSRTAQQMESATSGVGGETATTAPREVVVRGPSLISRLFGTTQRFLTGALEVIILLYFLLASGDLFLQKLVKVLPSQGDKRKAVEIARATESSISTYLLTTAVVNITEGIAVGIALYLLGMPNPALWGALVAIFEFIPYLGAAAMTVILTIAAITTFESTGQAMLVPAAFLVINLIQGNLVSPTLLGHRLALNPVAIFVGLAFWYSVWGIPGAFLAVPILAALKILCDHVESLAAFGEFLGGRDEGERRALLR